MIWEKPEQDEYHKYKTQCPLAKQEKEQETRQKKLLT